MTEAYKQFKINIESLHNLTVVYEAFNGKVGPLDISDMLRAQIVLAVSALDCYCHDVCLEVMLFIFQHKNFETNNSFKNFVISLNTLHQISNSNQMSEKIFFLSKEIRRRNSYKSFQEPKNISEALSNIGITKIWVKIGVTLNQESIDLQNRLSLIISRRNQIAHESDINPILGIGDKYSIDDSIVKETIFFLNEIVDSIEKVIDEEGIVT